MSFIKFMGYILAEPGLITQSVVLLRHGPNFGCSGRADSVVFAFPRHRRRATEHFRWATMRSSLLLIFLGCSIAMSQTNQTTQNNPADAGRQLRMMMLTTSAKGVSIQPTKSFPRVFGVLMDWPLGPQTVTVVSLCDGTSSIYTTSTFGVIGGIGHESVRSAAVQFVSAAEKHHDSAAPTKEYPYPKPGRVRFYLVCFDGVRVIDEDEVALKTGKDPCSDLWAAGQHVMTELRSITQQQKGDKP